MQSTVSFLEVSSFLTLYTLAFNSTLSDSFNAMPRPSFTVEQARAAGQRSAQLRAERKLNPPVIVPIVIQDASPNAEPTLSPYANKLAHAQDVLLDELLTTDSPKDKASLAQALKNLRETYHLATGLAKPGVLKPVNQRPRQQSRELPDAPDTQ